MIEYPSSTLNNIVRTSYNKLPVRFQIDNKIKEGLAAKDARLEELELKVTHLEDLKSKVIRLEEKDLQQELLIKELLKEREVLTAIGERSVGRSVSFPRTCRELRASDPTLTSGMHWIDPDGQGVGDDPIYVYCNMATGKFVVKTYCYYMLSFCDCDYMRLIAFLSDRLKSSNKKLNTN